MVARLKDRIIKTNPDRIGKHRARCLVLGAGFFVGFLFLGLFLLVVNAAEEQKYESKNYIEEEFGSVAFYKSLRERFDRWVFGKDDTVLLRRKATDTLTLYASRSFRQDTKRELTLGLPIARLLVWRNTGLKMETPDNPSEADIHFIFINNFEEPEQFLRAGGWKNIDAKTFLDMAHPSKQGCFLYNEEHNLEIVRTLAVVKVTDEEITNRDFTLPSIACVYKAILYHFGAANIPNVDNYDVVAPHIEFDDRIGPNIQYHRILKMLYSGEFSKGLSRQEVLAFFDRKIASIKERETGD